MSSFLGVAMSRNSVDQVISFELPMLNASAAVMVFQQGYQSIMARHQYPRSVAFHMADCFASCILLARLSPVRGDYTVQYRGEGEIRTIVAKVTDAFDVRGYVGSHAVPSAATVSILHQGQLVLTQTHDGSAPHQSIIPLDQQSIGQAIQMHFSQTAQPSVLLIRQQDHQLCGVFVKQRGDLPLALGGLSWSEFLELLSHHAATDQHWVSADAFMQCIGSLTPVHKAVASSLHDRCVCSRKKMIDSVKLYGLAACMDILKDNRYVVVTCEYCTEQLSLTEAEIKALF